MAQKRTKKTHTDVFAARVKRLRGLFVEHELDSFLVANPRDIQYLTGFRGEDAHLLVREKGKPILISDSRFATELRDLKRKFSIHMRTALMCDAVAEVVVGTPLAAIGIQAEFVTLANRKALAKAVGARKLKETQGVLGKLRIFKDESEIKLLRRGVKVAQEALTEMLTAVKPGVTEYALAARLDYEMRIRGAQDESFPAIVAAQANGALPHAVPGPTKVRKGRPLLVDWGACIDGYRSDLTRTFHVGPFSRQMREIYEIVLESQLAGIAAIKPGASGKEVDDASRKVIVDAGYGKYFGHGLGHGIGLDVHEAPSLSWRSSDVLEPGMVVTVEPGIYLPDIGGVRIEDDVLVTERGHKVLSNYPKDIESAVL
ncbi:MAG: M24 family metallopeptidase [Phycisphaerales bacterium JB038]